MDIVENDDGLTRVPDDTAADEQAATAVAPEAQPTVDIVAELKTAIDEHFASVKSLIKLAKEKDANVSRLSAMLQQYRDGYAKNLFRAVALQVISYREDSKRALREFGNRPLSVETVQKYLGYIVTDFEDLLGNLAVESVDGAWRYNGKDINCTDAVKPEFKEPEPFDIPELTVEPKGIDGVAEYIKAVEEQIRAALVTSAARDRLLSEYIQYSAVYESGVQQIVLYPVIRRIVKLYERTAATVKELVPTLTEETGKQQYLDVLSFVVEETEDILVECGVSIDPVDEIAYNPKKQRILKMLATEDEALNGTVATRYTDCYLMDDKVIYPQKVDVYKK